MRPERFRCACGDTFPTEQVVAALTGSRPIAEPALAALDAAPHATGRDRRRLSCTHEAGHAVTALAFGGSVDAIGVDPQPVLLFTLRHEPLHELLVVMLAGHAAARPGYSTDSLGIFARLHEARAGRARICDECVVALKLAALRPDANDLDLAGIWRLAQSTAAAFVVEPIVANSISSIADALNLSGRLEGPGISNIVDVAALRAVAAAYRRSWQ